MENSFFHRIKTLLSPNDQDGVIMYLMTQVVCQIEQLAEEHEFDYAPLSSDLGLDIGCCSWLLEVAVVETEEGGEVARSRTLWNKVDKFIGINESNAYPF